MKISFNWLSEYIDIPVSPDKLSEILTNLGLEVEEIEEWESVPGGLKDVVIGKVLTCMKHPDADKLTLTTVDAGQSVPLQIVCGAPNVAPGQKVPVALVGAKVMGNGKEFEIKRSKIRGELSEGMICAEDELGLGSSHEGIMVLNPEAIPGTPAAEYFNIERDTVYTIGLTPNRIDSGSHFGVARDIAAFLNLKRETNAIFPSVADFVTNNKNLTIPVEIENSRDCKRYSGLTISDVNIAESPRWLQNKLRAVGHSPVNNVVDITNFILLEMGQPLHAFDADKIEGGKVIVKNMPSKSRFITLDGVERELNANDLMICNAISPMCIAGVFGGIQSGVTSATRNIFLESAWFNPVAVRRTSKRHGLHTDASFRFERGADINITISALKRAAVMIREIAGGEISSDIIDVYPIVTEEALVDIYFENIDRLIGKAINKSTIKKILLSLDFTITEETGKLLRLSVPTYRIDVTREADVIEEILRVYGFNNVETGEHFCSTLTYKEKPDRERAVNTIADLLAANGFSEMMSNSLIPAKWFAENSDFDPNNLVILANPLSSDLNAMRQSLLPGGLSAIAYNINRQNTTLRLFEFGNCYFINKKKKNDTPVDGFREKTDLDLFITGNISDKTWNSEEVKADFFHIKGYTEIVLKRMGVNLVSIQKDTSLKGYYSESIAYLVNGNTIATAGRVSDRYLEQFELKQDVYHGHIEWDNLLMITKANVVTHKSLPKYPAVRRDLALLVNRNVTFNDIEKLAYTTEKNMLRSVSLFDVYEHESLGNDKISYAVSFVLRDDLRTLNEKTIDKVMKNLLKAFESNLGASLRQ